MHKSAKVEGPWKALRDKTTGFWFVGTDNGSRLRHGRRNAFVTRYKTAKAASERADRQNAAEAR